MSEIKQRIRKVDLENMSLSELEILSSQLGKGIAKIMDEANLKCNEILNIYGMQTKINYEITQLSKKIKETKKTSRKSKKSKKEQSLEIT